MAETQKKVLIQMRDLRVGNGIASCIMNYYEKTFDYGFHIDFLLNRDIESPFKDRVVKRGSIVYVLPKDTSLPNIENFKYISSVVNLGYDIIHVNCSGLNALVCLFWAKSLGVRKRIYHAHNPKESSSIKARVRSEVYENPCIFLANQYAACSKNAGDSLFNKRHYSILKNAMNENLYYYDERARIDYRNLLNIEDKFVIGVVGRIAEQKNPFFTIDVFSEIKKRKENAVLLWVGDGPLLKSLKSYVLEKNISEYVIFLGQRFDVNKLYSSMDIFLLPSKFEGFGLVFIEAQISGLHCFGSDKVPEDVEVSELMNRIPLSKNASEWACEIVDKSLFVSTEQRNDHIQTGFNIDDVCNGLINLYSL